MPRSHRLYLTDIQRAIGRINEIMQTIDEAAFKQRSLETDGVLFNLMTIGEAAKALPPHIRELAPEIDWAVIGRFRDFVAHHYFSLDMDQVWNVVQHDLPVLNQQVAHLLTVVKDPDNGEK